MRDYVMREVNVWWPPINKLLLLLLLLVVLVVARLCHLLHSAEPKMQLIRCE